MARARTSVTAPGEVGTMILTVRFGNWSCARPAPVPSASDKIALNSAIKVRIFVLVSYVEPAETMSRVLRRRTLSNSLSLVQREHFARERGAHDLYGPAGDHETARLAPHALDRHFGCGAQAAMELHAMVGGFETELGAENLDHERLMPLQQAVVGFPRRPICHKLASL